MCVLCVLCMGVCLSVCVCLCARTCVVCVHAHVCIYVIFLNNMEHAALILLTFSLAL